MTKRAKYIVIGFLSVFAFSGNLWAKVVKVVVTGNSYAALYPCGHCPASVGGGVARRATVIDELRKKEDVLLLDAGNFTGGGLMDEESIGYMLDRRRTLYYLKVMEKLNYDAVLVGEDDFNFGVDFLEENMKKYRINFISSNLQIKGVLPYIIKEVGGVKIGILGLTSSRVADRYNVKMKDYKVALKENIKKIMPSVDMIVLLSNLDDNFNRRIVRNFKDIKLIISSGHTLSGAFYEKEGGAYIVRPSYQAKELRIIELSFKGEGSLDYNFSRRRLSFNIHESPVIKRMIPACVSDSNCSPRKGLVARCVEGATSDAHCVYEERERVEAYIITDKSCPFCITEPTEKYLASIIPGIHFNIIDYRGKGAKELIRKYNITTLPAFLLESNAKNTRKFTLVEQYFEIRKDMFVAKKEITGIFRFLNRQPIHHRLDIFFSLSDTKFMPVIEELYRLSREKGWEIQVHFVLPRKKDYISNLERGEVRTFLAVQKLYPQKFWDYFLQRLKEGDISSGEVMKRDGISFVKVDNFVHSDKIKYIVSKEEEFMREVNARRGFAIMVNNVWLFQVLNFSPEQLAKIFSLPEQ